MGRMGLRRGRSVDCRSSAAATSISVVHGPLRAARHGRGIVARHGLLGLAELLGLAAIAFIGAVYAELEAIIGAVYAALDAIIGAGATSWR